MGAPRPSMPILSLCSLHPHCLHELTKDEGMRHMKASRQGHGLDPLVCLHIRVNNPHIPPPVFHGGPRPFSRKNNVLWPRTDLCHCRCRVRRFWVNSRVFLAGITQAGTRGRVSLRPQTKRGHPFIREVALLENADLGAKCYAFRFLHALAAPTNPVPSRSSEAGSGTGGVPPLLP